MASRFCLDLRDTGWHTSASARDELLRCRRPLHQAAFEPSTHRTSTDRPCAAAASKTDSRDRVRARRLQPRSPHLQPQWHGLPQPGGLGRSVTTWPPDATSAASRAASAGISKRACARSHETKGTHDLCGAARDARTLLDQQSGTRNVFLLLFSTRNHRNVTET